MKGILKAVVTSFRCEAISRVMTVSSMTPAPFFERSTPLRSGKISQYDLLPFVPQNLCSRTVSALVPLNSGPGDSFLLLVFLLQNFNLHLWDFLRGLLRFGIYFVSQAVYSFSPSVYILLLA